jgi:hypothetical protein
MECIICLEEVKDVRGIVELCRDEHRVCRTCLIDMVLQRIRDTPIQLPLACCGHTTANVTKRCPHTVSDALVTRIVPTEHHAEWTRAVRVAAFQHSDPSKQVAFWTPCCRRMFEVSRDDCRLVTRILPCPYGCRATMCTGCERQLTPDELADVEHRRQLEGSKPAVTADAAADAISVAEEEEEEEEHKEATSFVNYHLETPESEGNGIVSQVPYISSTVGRSNGIVPILRWEAAFVQHQTASDFDLPYLAARPRHTWDFQNGSYDGITDTWTPHTEQQNSVVSDNLESITRMRMQEVSEISRGAGGIGIVFNSLRRSAAYTQLPLASHQQQQQQQKSDSVHNHLGPLCFRPDLHEAPTHKQETIDLFASSLLCDDTSALDATLYRLFTQVLDAAAPHCPVCRRLGLKSGSDCNVITCQCGIEWCFMCSKQIFHTVGGTCAARACKLAGPFPPFTPQVIISAARAALITK